MWFVGPIAHRREREHASNALPLPARRRGSPLPSRSARLPTLQDHRYGLEYHAMCLFPLPAFAGYSLCLPMEGWLRLSRPGCLLCSAPTWFTCLKTVTHPGTNRAWRRVTTLIETSVLPLSQTSNSLYFGECCNYLFQISPVPGKMCTCSFCSLAWCIDRHAELTVFDSPIKTFNFCRWDASSAARTVLERR